MRGEGERVFGLPVHLCGAIAFLATGGEQPLEIAHPVVVTDLQVRRVKGERRGSGFELRSCPGLVLGLEYIRVRVRVKSRVKVRVKVRA